MYWLLVFLFSTAFAKPDIRIAVATNEAVQGTAKELVCSSISEELSICFRYFTDGKLRYADKKDLLRWGVSSGELHSEIKKESLQRVNAARYTFHEIPDMKGMGYWVSDAFDGWDVAALLHPRRLLALLGKNALVRIPEDGIFVFWEKGNPVLSKIMAVGIKEMYTNSKFPVSPLVYHSHEGQWQAWGEAVPVSEE